MGDLTELRKPGSDYGWSVDNHDLVTNRLHRILNEGFGNVWEKIELGSTQMTSGSKVIFEATLTRTVRPEMLDLYDRIERPARLDVLKIKGEMILNASFRSTQSATPALECATYARVYYTERR